MGTLSYRDLGVVELEDGMIEFEVLPEHVKLLRSAKVKWGNGAPTIDPMKPYGLPDLYESMRYVLEEDEGPEYNQEEMDKLHKQTAVALQIAIVTGKFKAAKFRAPKYTQGWKEYRPKKEKSGEKPIPDAAEDPATTDD